MVDVGRSKIFFLSRLVDAMGCGASLAAPEPVDDPVLPRPSPPPSTTVTGGNAPSMPLAATHLPASSGRKLTAKSKPFWELEAERERKKRLASSPSLEEQTPSASSATSQGNDDAVSPEVEAEVKALVARVLARVTRSRTEFGGGPSEVQPRVVPMFTTLEAEVEPPASSEPIAPRSPQRPRPPHQPPFAFAHDAVCSAEGCDCGSDGPIPIAPAVWIESFPTPRAREREWAWLDKLSVEAFRVLRMKGTEEIHSGTYCEHFEDGTYLCAGCERPLYDAAHKFQTGHGWPAFCDNLPDGLIRHTVKRKVEIVCAGCDGHIGHVFFSKRYPKPHHERHCVNSVSLRFVPRHEE